MGKLEFTGRKQENWSLRIESRRTEVYRLKVGELEFTDRKRRTGVYSKKVGKLEFVNLYFCNK